MPRKYYNKKKKSSYTRRKLKRYYKSIPKNLSLKD